MSEVFATPIAGAEAFGCGCHLFPPLSLPAPSPVTNQCHPVSSPSSCKAGAQENQGLESCSAFAAWGCE